MPSFPRPAVITGLLLLAGFGPAGRAQLMIPAAPPAPPAALPAALADAARPDDSLAVPPAVPGNLLPAGASWSWHPRVTFAQQHGDGLPVRPGLTASTSSTEFSAGLTLNAGPHVALDYGFTRRLYSNEAFRNTTGQSASLALGGVFRPGTVRFIQSYAESEVPLVETAAQTRVRTHRSELEAGTGFGPGGRLELSLRQEVRFMEQAATDREWPVALRYVRRLGPAWEIGAGLAGGWVDLDPGGRQSWWRPELRCEWQPRPPLTLRLTAGREYRSISQPDAQVDRSTYSAAVDYRPFAATRVSLRREQDSTVSLFSSQLSDNTRTIVELQQRLLGRAYLAAGFSRRASRYRGDLLAGGAEAAPVRSDRGRTTSLRLSLPVHVHGLVAVWYQRNHNDSNLPGYAFAGTEYGFELGCRF